MEEHSVFVETHESIAPIDCSECDGEARVIRRAPYPFEGLEFRTFEGSENGTNHSERKHVTSSDLIRSTVPTPAWIRGRCDECAKDVRCD